MPKGCATRTQNAMGPEISRKGAELNRTAKIHKTVQKETGRCKSERSSIQLATHAEENFQSFIPPSFIYDIFVTLFVFNVFFSCKCF